MDVPGASDQLYLRTRVQGQVRQTNLRGQTRSGLGWLFAHKNSLEGTPGGVQRRGGVEWARGRHAAVPPPSRRRHPQPINSQQSNVEFVSPLGLLPIDFPLLRIYERWIIEQQISKTLGNCQLQNCQLPYLFFLRNGHLSLRDWSVFVNYTLWLSS